MKTRKNINTNNGQNLKYRMHKRSNVEINVQKEQKDPQLWRNKHAKRKVTLQDRKRPDNLNMQRKYKA